MRRCQTFTTAFALCFGAGSQTANTARFLRESSRIHRIELREGEHLLELDDPTSSSMAPIFSDTWLGTELWPAARALVALLEERRTALASAAQVLELGAGTGACGLAAAALGARRVLLTDKPVLLPLMRANVAANRFDSGGGCVVECAELTWRSRADERRSAGDEHAEHDEEHDVEHASEGAELPTLLPAGADLVLASDCLNPVSWSRTLTLTRTRCWWRPRPKLEQVYGDGHAHTSPYISPVSPYISLYLPGVRRRPRRRPRGHHPPRALARRGRRGSCLPPLGSRGGSRCY